LYIVHAGLLVQSSSHHTFAKLTTHHATIHFFTQEGKEWAAIKELETIKARQIEEERIQKEALNLSDGEDDEVNSNNFLFTMR